MSWKDHNCPFCGANLALSPSDLKKIGPALYEYQPCGCPVQFNAHGYPRKPKKL